MIPRGGGLPPSHPPVYYFPRADVAEGALLPSGSPGSLCEWKGAASFLDVVGGAGRTVERGAWSFRSPTRGFEPIAGAVAFYAGAMDECTVAGELVAPQPGGFYGGWITNDLEGPFKGGPGTRGW